MNESQRAAAERLIARARLEGASIATVQEVFFLLRELVSEPVQEPERGWLEAAVAWEVCASIHKTWAKGKDALFTTRHADFVKHADDARANAKLYAAPQQRKPLTDEQIDRLDTQAIHGGPDSQYAFRFARAVEKAHGITGEPT